MNRIICFLFVLATLNLSAQKTRTVNDTIDVLHYDINLNMLNMGAQYIDGFTVLTLVSLSDSVETLTLDLLNLSVDSVIVSNSLQGFNQIGEKLIIELSNQLNTSDTVDVFVYYAGNPQMDASGWGGFYFSSDSIYAYNLGVGFEADPHNFGRVWFPCIDNFVDRATYDFRIRVATQNTAVCGGMLIEVIDNGDNTKTFHWHLSDPIPTYLASVAVGRFTLVSDMYHGIERDIPIEIYVRPQDSINVTGTFTNLKTALTVFENSFGAYRWQRVGYVGVPFNYGAMEHATNIAYPAVVINGGTAYDDLMSHELAHSWFGNLATCRSAEDMWINEGWASFAEFVFFEQLYGKEYAKNIIRDIHKQMLQMVHIVDGDYMPVCGVPQTHTYSRTVYDKGSLVAHNLRTYLGDSLFFYAVAEWLNDYAFQDISCLEFENYLSNITQRDLSDFFEAWVFSPGFAHFSVDSFKVETLGANTYEVEVFVRQRLNGRTQFANSNIIELSFSQNNWSVTTDTMTFSGELGSKKFVMGFSPEQVLLNLDEKLCLATISYHEVVKQTGISVFPNTHFGINVTHVNDSAWLRASHHWVAPDDFKTPQPDVLRISDYRYWSIEGFDLENIKANGRFYYNRSTPASPGLSNNGWLDNTLFDNTADSLLLLYRKNSADDWQIQSFTRIGNNMIGYIISDTLKAGEYVLAIGKPAGTDIKHIERTAPEISVIPNPSSSHFTVEFSEAFTGKISIYDTGGKMIKQSFYDKPISSYQWTPHNTPNGIYHIIFENENFKVSKKLVYTKK